MRKTIKIIILGLWLGLALAHPEAMAANTKKKAAPLPPKMEATANQNMDHDELQFHQINEHLTQIELTLKEENFTRQNLDEASTFLNETALSLDSITRKLEKELAYAQESLAVFGESNSEDTETNTTNAAMREKYTTAVASYKNKLIEANLLKTEIIRLQSAVSEARGRVIFSKLLQKNALVVPRTFFRALSDAAIFFWQIAISPIEWYQSLNEEGKHNFLYRGWYMLLIVALALSLGLYIRRYIINHWGYRRTVDQPGYWQKVLVAIVTAFAYGVIPSLLIGGGLLLVYSNADLVDTRFGELLSSALEYALYIILARAATRVVLAPWNGRWRLFNISDTRAERAFSAITLSFILIGVMAYLRNTAVLFDGSDELKLLLNVSSDAIRAFVIIMVAVAVYGDIKTKDEDEEDKNADTTEQTSEDEDEKMSSSARVILFSTLFALTTFFISLFGYPDLATMIFLRFFASIFLIGIFVVVRTMISDLLRRSIIFWIKTFKMRKSLLSKVDFLMSLLITPILVAVLMYMLLRLWGMPSSDLMYAIKKLIFGFKVGGIKISLIAILTGLLVFFISLSIVKIFKNRLSNSLLNRINMDEGIKHSLVSGVSFTGFIISVILAVAAMGVDLSNLAVIAGALSVGIGFGLQDIIKNLVSGIIILFERPFKVGDWVILDGEEGKIKQINIRSTELETWTKRSVIIPNATLISSSLINLTHGDNWQRQSILVGVSYDSDVELVTKVLLECAKTNRKVAKVPSPMVIFKDFGASSLDFELRFHVLDVRSDWNVSSDIRYEITKRFREENIEIAYPQLDIHQR